MTIVVVSVILGSLTTSDEFGNGDERAMRRRRLLFGMLGLSGALVVGLVWWYNPWLSGDERRLVGSWVAPEPDPRVGFVTAKGPVTHPCRVWEFRRDRSFRVWVVSADDSSVSILDKEGLWSADGGTLRIEGFGAVGDALRELRERIRIRLGYSYVGRSSGGLAHSVRFLDDDAWELTTAQGRSITWKRQR
jgi:hypothetical protein